MLDVILDTLLDTIKLVPFLFIAFLLIELFEHKFSNKSKKVIAKSGNFGPILGALVGVLPQCGFGVLATNLYATRIISIGTLVSVYLSTSDEMLPILLTSDAKASDILLILGIKVLVGIIFGFIIDLVIRKKDKKDFHICDEEGCDCEHSLIKSSIIHSLKILSFILIITFGLNLLFEYVSLEKIDSLFMKNSMFAPFISSIVGLIPNCAASVVITELYLNEVITMGTCISGLLTNSGIAILVLFKSNKKLSENIFIFISIYGIGVFIGMLLNIIGL